MASVSVHVITPAHPTYQGVWQLREDVLRKPLGLSLNDEDLSGEVRETILAAMDAELVIGCLLMHPISAQELKLRQMAVAPSFQQKGIGNQLLQKAEELAAAQQYSLISLHARQTAVPFYQKAGYSVVGDLFTEVGIPHLLMHKFINETLS